MDTPKVSVIIPTKNSDSVIAACLHSIAIQSYKKIEVIVVDNNSTDKTKEISKNYTQKVFNQGPERSAQRNFGVKKASGEYVFIIDSDMQLSRNVVKSCVRAMLENKKFQGIIVPEESFGEGYWAACKKLERSFYVNCDWMEAARFFRKSAFEEINGYNVHLNGGEDYDVSQRIEEKYGKGSIGRISSFIYHNEGRLNLVKTLRKKFYYAQNLDAYSSQEANASKYKQQASIVKRYQLFFSQPQKLLTNPIIAGGMLFMKTAEFGAGGFGYIKGKL